MIFMGFFNDKYVFFSHINRRAKHSTNRVQTSGCYREGNTPNKDDIPKCSGAKSLDFNSYQEASIICVDHIHGNFYLDFMDVVSI